MKFFKEVSTELKKVVWPTKNITALYAFVVILVSLFVAYYLGLLDYLFTNYGLRNLLG